MFYKVILNGMVVDTQAELRYVCWQEANKLMIMCSEEMANGIISSDSSVIWHVEGFPEFPDGLCQTVIVEEIEEDEYLRWKERLESATTGTEETTETEGTTEESPAENATAEESASKAYLSIQDILTIQELMNKVEKLEKENELLSECLIEMSEKVYA